MLCTNQQKQVEPVLQMSTYQKHIFLFFTSVLSIQILF